MPINATALIAALLAYLIGSVSFGLIIAKQHGVDLRHSGSGNTGATNVGRAVGKREGRRVLVLDGLKGTLPTLAAGFVFGFAAEVTALVATMTVAGHCWPIWHGFRGGKGAATAAGAILVLSPIAGLLAVVTYLVAKKRSRKVSVGSLAGALVGAVAALGLSLLQGGLGAQAIGACTIASLVWLRHASNLARLAQGTEPDA